MMRKQVHITLFLFGLSGTVFAETLAMPPQPEPEPEASTEAVPAPASTEAVPAPEAMATDTMPSEAAEPEPTAKTFTPPPPAPVVGKDGSYSITLPGRGMTMEQVENKFGSPSEKFPEVGEPPIIRWNYPGFTVYFEYQFVINAVASVQAPPAR